MPSRFSAVGLTNRVSNRSGAVPVEQGSAAARSPSSPG